MIKLARQLDPSAVMIENVRGLMQSKFDDYRAEIVAELELLGYKCDWQELQASHFGVSQLRPRSLLVALKPEYWEHFDVEGWYKPQPGQEKPLTIGELLRDSMVERGLKGAALENWYQKASSGIAPTLVGGSKKHGGADLGPTRAKRAWENLGVSGLGVADEPDKEGNTKNPARDLGEPGKTLPMITVKQAALVQGFGPEEEGGEGWIFQGRKTAAYRQVGNAFPPPWPRPWVCRSRPLLRPVPGCRSRTGACQLRSPAPLMLATVRTMWSALASGDSCSQKRSTVQPASSSRASVSRSRAMLRATFSDQYPWLIFGGT